MSCLQLGATYGFTEHLHFEGEAMGASSGEARFESAMFDGREGTLIRTATVGRIVGGALLRFRTEKYLPYVRLGVGLQGTSYDSRFTVSGVEAEGPGSSFDIDGLWYFGLGMDVHWGVSVVAGLAVSSDYLISSNSRSLQAGIHLGYTWHP